MVYDEPASALGIGSSARGGSENTYAMPDPNHRMDRRSECSLANQQYPTTQFPTNHQESWANNYSASATLTSEYGVYSHHSAVPGLVPYKVSDNYPVIQALQVSPKKETK
jgi:hypothetical protein